MLRDYQAALVEDVYAAWAGGAVNVGMVLPTGGGKCLGRGTPVLMFDGTVKNVEDVKFLDVLMGPDSSPRIVKGTCHGREMLYRVSPTRGEPYVVNESHVLSLKKTREKSGGSNGEIVNISVNDYLNKSEWFRHIHKGWRTGVNFVAKNQIIPPYLLGLWLAEGTHNKAEFSVSDDELLTYLKLYSMQKGYGFWCEWDAGSWHINISNHGSHRHGLLHDLRRLNVTNGKHVPYQYRTGDRKQRLELLAGYLDGDGYLHNGGYDCIAKQRELAEGIAFVARSLGFACYISKCQKGISDTGFFGDYYRLSISGDVSEIPVIVPRRKAPPRRQKKNVLMTGISVEPIGIGDYFGFEIAGNDSLFLLGDFTVTHNTKTLSNIIHNYSNPSAVVAHRQELVGQLSTALAEEGVYHRIIAPQPVVNFCIARHIKVTGRSFHHAQAPCACGGVRTVLTRAESLKQFYSSVGLQIHDEAHHVLRENEWGRAAALFERAYGLFPTATPLRADRKALGRTKSGILDKLVIGPSMHDLINRGHLSKYRIFGLPNSIDLTAVDVSDTTGDYNQTQLRREAHKSRIVGDIVGSYLAHIPGKRAIVFAVDVEQAGEIAIQFTMAGLRAAAVSAKTPDAVRQGFVDKFADGHLDILVNVDLFGEGFDVPACEAVIMARPTMSYGLFVQQFGRALRIFPGKTHGFILDHVENITRHGPRFFRPQRWSLDDEERGRRKRDPEEIPITTCTQCFWPYEAVFKGCPNCGHVEKPAGRGAPELVAGDLTEFSPELLAALRGEQERIDGPLHLPASIAENSPAGTAAKRNWQARQAVQAELRESMAAWAGIQKYSHDRSDSEIYRRFYFRFGLDMQTAVTLGTAEATTLLNEIRGSMS